MSRIRAWAAHASNRPLEPYAFEAGEVGADEVEVAVEYCGICHSDLSMLENEWGMTAYPFVPGHEAIGRVVALGRHAQGVRIGQRVGIGWNAASCTHCPQCLSGEQHLCTTVQGTIMGRPGAFAERIRAHWLWVIPIPGGVDPAAAGPLLCGGITVFSPLLLHDIKPTQRVGVVGIGGLGHMALKFCNAWGCEVTAFTSSRAKYEEAKSLGAHHVVSSREPAALKSIASTLDLIIYTPNAPVDWSALIATLRPKGTLHVVGAVTEPIPVNVFELIAGQLSISASPTGSRSAIDTMLDFAARHAIAPVVEHYPMSRVNEAMNHLREGKARYRVVLDADWAGR